MSKLFNNFLEFLSIRTESNDTDQEGLKRFILNSFSADCTIEQLVSNGAIMGFIIKINESYDKPGIIFSGHCDTVPISGVKVSEDDFLITGRGSVDMKYFISCIFGIKSEIKKRRFTFPIYLCLSCDEEVSTLGVQLVINSLEKEKKKFDLCIVGEPTNFLPCNSHCGYYGVRFDVQTTSGHSAIYSMKSNAIYCSIQMIQQIIDAKVCSKINISSFSSTQISNNSNATHCTFVIELRPNGKEDVDEILRKIDIIVSQVSTEISVNYEVETGFIPAFFSEYKSDCARLFDCNQPGAFAAASEAPFYKCICKNVIVYGAGKIEAAHSDKEFILKDDLIRYSKDILNLLDRYNKFQED